MPPATFDNLNVVTVEPLTKQRLKTFLATPKNARTYKTWVIEVVRRNIDPGQRGLVIVRKDFAAHLDVQSHDWGTGWDLDGRKLYVTHWGDGIGFNSWADASVVFLFDEFFIPKGQVIATANGLRGVKATGGPAGSMAVLSSPQVDVDALWTGHLLRWSAQMALRGNARNFDEHGRCGHQKLVWAAGPDRLREYWRDLFPGAPLPVPSASVEVPDAPKRGRQTHAERFLAVITRPDLCSAATGPDTVSAGWAAKEAGVPRSALTRDVLPLGAVQRTMVSYGWEYLPGKGKLPGMFRRTLEAGKPTLH